jgi:uncharacterized cofD-like protein
MRRYGFMKWLTVGIGVKRWLVVLSAGIAISALALGIGVLKLASDRVVIITPQTFDWGGVLVILGIGVVCITVALLRLSRSLLAPYRRYQQDAVVDTVVAHHRLNKGFHFVAIGGGTGLPATLKGIKPYTHHITAIVTVADDGGSSGRIRRDMGVLPPGDIRNNIVALADEDSVLTKLFQYRFESGDLEGHSFGNLFIASLANVVSDDETDKNSLAEALTEVERVLNIQGRVLPATLDDIRLVASIQLRDSQRTIKVMGEAQTADVDGHIVGVHILPEEATAYADSVRAIQDADIIVVGPGSLYTSLIPNLKIRGIAEALRASRAYKIYVCNIATQPVETENYSVADHVLALEKHIGRGVFQAIIANNHFPLQNAGQNTLYVTPVDDNHEIHQRYEVRYTDLTDSERPWRHDSSKLAQAILSLTEYETNGIKR